MRSSKSRSRSKANRPRTLGNIVNRVFDSSGPEGKVRGTPAQIIEKYQFLARDAQLSNDRVAAENFLQHAEHYTRLLAEAMREQQAEQEARQQYHQQNQQGGQQGSGGGNRDRDGGSYGSQNGQNGDRRDPRFDRRENRFDRDDQPQPHAGGAGLGPVIDADDEDEAGPVETPEATRTEGAPGDSGRPEAARSENTRSERPRFEGNRRNQDQRGGEADGDGEGQRPPRGPRPQQNRPPRAAAGAAQPDLPVFITGAPDAEPAAPAAEKPARPRAPRKPAARAKPAEPVVAEGEGPKGE
jgi:hypothetical protein